MAHSSNQHVAILMGSFNGKEHLETQLVSLAEQTHQNWRLWVSDDGSTDGTIEILKSYVAAWGPHKLRLLKGPQQGFVANFLFLACHPEISADYYTFADQDDIWEPNKLERLLSVMNQPNRTSPILYCGRTRLINESGFETGVSPLFDIKPSFQNALVQSIAGGNTMAMNNAARDLVKQAGSHVSVASHDWWIYLLVSGCGGQVIYDPEPLLRYRQHLGNFMGANRGFIPRLSRLLGLIQGRFKDWNEQNLSALATVRKLLTPENQFAFDAFSQARKVSLLSRIRLFRKSGVYRQSRLEGIALLLAAIFNRI